MQKRKNGIIIICINAEWGVIIGFIFQSQCVLSFLSACYANERLQVVNDKERLVKEEERSVNSVKLKTCETQLDNVTMQPARLISRRSGSWLISLPPIERFSSLAFVITS
uniref:Uncharacterized protein n=1 Tax=Glossina austeni TaxID=7395 RepID=A0A1A9V8Z8_GLOAU